jgi:hypothetical protein
MLSACSRVVSDGRREYELPRLLRAAARSHQPEAPDALAPLLPGRQPERANEDNQYGCGRADQCASGRSSHRLTHDVREIPGHSCEDARVANATSATAALRYAAR